MSSEYNLPEGVVIKDWGGNVDDRNSWSADSYDRSGQTRSMESRR